MRPEHLKRLKSHLLELQSNVLFGRVVKQEIVPQPILPGDGDLAGRVPEVSPPKLPPLLPLPRIDDEKPLRLDPPVVRRRKPESNQVLPPDLGISRSAGDTDVLHGPVVMN